MAQLSHSEQCPHCGRYQNRPCVVDAVIFNTAGEVLLIKRGRDPEKGKFALPGGFIDWDESAAEAVVREVKEETDLDVKVVSFSGYYDDIQRDIKRRTISLVFLCETTSSTQATAGDDAVDHGWFSVDKLPDIAFDHIQIINDALKKEGI